MGMLQMKRVYEAPEEQDGYRILVDRLWPRGISREKAKLDLWAKSIAPTNELRAWYGHVPERFGEFARRYREELTWSRSEGWQQESFRMEMSPFCMRRRRVHSAMPPSFWKI